MAPHFIGSILTQKRQFVNSFCSLEKKLIKFDILFLEAEITETKFAQSEENINNVEYSLKIVRQYTDIQELNARVVNDLIDKIKIHALVKENGQHIQQIDIYYMSVGVIDIPQYFQKFAI